ncbi:Golgi-resident adenosine 3',5'-bisphosphate 3'-phosphatase [Lampetra fluviatilis]
MALLGLRSSTLCIALIALATVALLYRLLAALGATGAGPPFASQPAGNRELDLRVVLSVALLAAERGGSRVAAARGANAAGRVRSKGKTREGAEELLTPGDIASHRAMVAAFHHALPGVKVISEETDNTDVEDVEWDHSIHREVLERIPHPQPALQKALTVWLDPLDATQEYTDNLVKYVTTMVCVAINGKPVIGVIHKPFLKLTVWGFVGRGHSANVQQRHAGHESPVFIVSRSHAGNVARQAHAAFGNKSVIVPAGGAGYKVLSLLDVTGDDSDKADVYIHTTLIKKWDICAGNAILTALGGHMTTLRGEEIVYEGSPKNEGGLLASATLDHTLLLKKLSVL